MSQPLRYTPPHTAQHVVLVTTVSHHLSDYEPDARAAR
jgi:hypothetical protein